MRPRTQQDESRESRHPAPPSLSRRPGDACRVQAVRVSVGGPSLTGS
ncbi:hypothetical protein STXM2123_4964 [Streptomyces sp. F-3]|nr:hypothetical protein STXM2123_4964 [Streptomyces sp. F-3]